MSQQYELLAEAADRRGGRLERRVNFILDEYGNFTPISDMTNKGKGDYAYTMMDLESEATEEIVKALEAVDGVLRVRIIK